MTYLLYKVFSAAVIIADAIILSSDFSDENLRMLTDLKISHIPQVLRVLLNLEKPVGKERKEKLNQYMRSHLGKNLKNTIKSDKYNVKSK